MKIVSKRRHVEAKRYSYSYEYADMPGAGYGFDCDAHGNIDETKVAAESLAVCRAGQVEVTRDQQWKINPDRNDVDMPYVPVYGSGRRVVVKLIDMGVQEYDASYTEAAIGECACGEEVHLDRFTNSCDCGRDYNMSGQLLADRSQWGEETGESAGDILAVDGMSVEACFE